MHASRKELIDYTYTAIESENPLCLKIAEEAGCLFDDIAHTGWFFRELMGRLAETTSRFLHLVDPEANTFS